MNVSYAEDAAKGEYVEPSPEVSSPDTAFVVKHPDTSAAGTPPNGASREATASIPVPEAVRSAVKRNAVELSVVGTSASEQCETTEVGAAENGAAAVSGHSSSVRRDVFSLRRTKNRHRKQ